jgi:methyl-accepting chemotaxis protein
VAGARVQPPADRAKLLAGLMLRIGRDKPVKVSSPGADGVTVTNTSSALGAGRTSLGTLGKAVFGPSERLMRRLKLPQKFALIAIVLATPFAFVGVSYINAQDTQAGFATQERVGIRAITPTLALLSAVDSARSAAAHGRPGSVSAVQAAAGGLDTVLARSSGQIDLSVPWAKVKGELDAAIGQSPATGATAVKSWSAVSSDVVNLIAAIADKSNLTLDPVLDSYYLQDAFTVKIPTLLDSSGLGADLAAVNARRNHDAIAIANGTITANMSGLATDLQKAVQSAKDAHLGPATLPSLSALRTSTALLTTALTNATAHPRGAQPVDLAAAPRRAADALANVVAPRLDTILQSHIGQFEHNKQTVEIVAAITLLLALWLFMGFFRSMTASVNDLIGVLGAIESGDLSRQAMSSADEIGQMGVALNRMRERMSEIVDRIAGTSVTLSTASEELSAVSNEMSSAAEQTSDRAGSVSAAAEQVSGSVQSVSAGTEEMGASINEIAKKASDAARVATEAVAVAETTDGLVRRLGESSREIDEVIKIISSIARQTNMLALNATIEAARAGEAGKGFAVVANEVKELARDTARSSEKIESNIAAIQADTKEAVSAIGQITSTIHDINDIQTMIAAAVEEQAATTNEIARSVGEAAAGSNEIAASITGVAETAQGTTSGAAETHRSAEELARLAAELLALTRQFRLAAPAESVDPIRDVVTSSPNGRNGSPGAHEELVAPVSTNGHR